VRVKIGNYPDRLMCKLYNNYMNKKYGCVDWPAEHTRFEHCLNWLDDRVQDFYNVFNWLWFDRRTQKVKVHIDRWDTWNMDGTLAHIVLPMLIQLKETKHGAPNVDKEDVPKDLWPNEAEEEAYRTNGQTDIHFFARWDWVVDEMIFAFASKMEDWEDQFYSGKHDVYFEKVPGEAGMSELKHGPNNTFKVDREGMQAYQDRISNGFRLFGKYYESLWD